MTASVVPVDGSLVFAEREGLLARIEERAGRRASPEIELEERSVELEGRVDISDFERDVVDADELSAGVVRIDRYVRMAPLGA